MVRLSTLCRPGCSTADRARCPVPLPLVVLLPLPPLRLLLLPCFSFFAFSVCALGDFSGDAPGLPGGRRSRDVEPFVQRSCWTKKREGNSHMPRAPLEMA